MNKVLFFLFITLPIFAFTHKSMEESIQPGAELQDRFIKAVKSCDPVALNGIMDLNPLLHKRIYNFEHIAERPKTYLKRKIFRHINIYQKGIYQLVEKGREIEQMPEGEDKDFEKKEYLKKSREYAKIFEEIMVCRSAHEVIAKKDVVIETLISSLLVPMEQYKSIESFELMNTYWAREINIQEGASPNDYQSQDPFIIQFRN